MGTDGLALPGPDGAPYRVNLAEKMLVLALARLFNFIPEAGLWMNTQRPEWNDANNALVGYGVSMVTLCYLRRFLAFCRGVFRRRRGALPSRSLPRSPWPSAGSRRRLEAHSDLLDGPISDRDRAIVLESLGSRGKRLPGQALRRGVFRKSDAAVGRRAVGVCDVALRISTTRSGPTGGRMACITPTTSCGWDGGGIAIRRLYEMLEGQMAALSSGALSGRESAELL